MVVVATGALVELQDERTDLASAGSVQVVVSGESDQLAVVARLFAVLASGERPVASQYAIGIGLRRRGTGAIWKRYVGPPALPGDPDERERFLNEYRIRQRDVEDAVNQMLGRDPEQHRPPHLSWQTLIERLGKEGLELREDQLIELPFSCEARLPAQLADSA
ncbi:MAG: hypothetical protein ABSG43_31420 [Solirubrobacteraceae bacterium]